MRSFTLISALGLCVVLAGIVSSQGEVPTAKDLRIAVVDISRLFKDYKGSVDRRKALVELVRSYGKRIKTLRRRVAQKRAELKEYATGTAEFLAKREELGARLKEERALQAKAAASRNAAWVKMLKDLYGDINRSVSEYAKEKKIHLVIKQQSMTDYTGRLGEVTREGMVLEISRRTVLHHVASLDITDAVLRRLDAEYAKRAKGKAAPGKTSAGTKGARGR